MGSLTGAASPCRGDAVTRMSRKSELPTKTCVACGRPFAWRKKWARDWESVKYCSQRCREAPQPAAAETRQRDKDGLPPK